MDECVFLIIVKKVQKNSKKTAYIRCFLSIGLTCIFIYIWYTYGEEKKFCFEIKMNRLPKVIVYTLIAAVIVPVGIFSSSPVVNAESTPDLNQVTNSLSIIQVVPAFSAQRVVASSQSARSVAASSVCDNSFGATGGIVQASTLNLNQPANCFSLVVGKTAAVPHITLVRQSGFAGIVTVLKNVRTYFEPYMLSSGSKQQDSALPLAAAAAVSIIAFEFVKGRQRSVKKLISQNIHTTTVEWYNLRC